MPSVTVLLATYNGEKYIRQMVDSILAQSFENWHLILSDDGSKDGTCEILEEYAQRYPQKITHYRSGQRFGCAQKHFMHLLAQYQTAEYIMFCDQDDIWHSDKIEKTLHKMLEIQKNEAEPTMIHTDLRVVDQELQELNPSFCAMSNLDGNRMAFHHLLVQNVVTGCTMMLNRALAQLACKRLPEDGILMHDWWIALLASACGQCGFLPEATIDYRQHGKNSVGAKDVRSISYLWKKLCAHDSKEMLKKVAHQAQLFLECYENVLDEQTKVILQDMSAVQTAGIFKRNRIFMKHKLYKYGTARVLAQFMGW